MRSSVGRIPFRDFVFSKFCANEAPVKITVSALLFEKIIVREGEFKEKFHMMISLFVNIFAIPR